MKRKVISVILSGLLLSSMIPHVSAESVEKNSAAISAVKPGVSIYEAGLIMSSSLSCSGGTKTVYISAKVYGNDIMSKIGFKNIRIQKSSDKSNWSTETTISDKISEKASYKTLSQYSVSVKGGYYYRIVLDNYAKENTWWFPDEQTLNSTSNAIWVS